jgi:hypothetical protein
LGVGEIIWLGAPCASSEAMARWLLADPSPFAGTTLRDYPSDIEYGSELAWAIGARSDGSERPPGALVCAAEDGAAVAMMRDFARARHLPFFAATTSRGGWIGASMPPCFPDAASDQEPIVAMLLAALLTDAVREALCPLAGSGCPPDGPLRLATPRPIRPGTAALVGLGGIGCYLATLTAILGYDLHLVDCDFVEVSNLNRQGLYVLDDAHQHRGKAAAAAAALARLFPQQGDRITAHTVRVGSRFQSTLARLQPAVLLAAVDNARTRLTLQTMACTLGLSLVYGGTDLFAADCYTQTPGSAVVDAQMYGQLSAAALREGRTGRRQGRHGGCAANPSYVVPGMVAAALMAYRLAQLTSYADCAQAPLPLHWRSGNLPIEQQIEQHRSPAHDDLALPDLAGLVQ